jgi:hypothetical protein
LWHTRIQREPGKCHSKNKANAKKKTYHHVLGLGGYRTAMGKWEAMEGELRTKRITLGTEGWPERAKHWWYGHGGC